MTTYDEIIEYFMVFGCSKEEAKEKADVIMNNDEAESFYKNMYID